MQMKARMSQQPAVDCGRLVRGVAVEDQMHLQGRGDCPIDAVEKVLKFLGTMSGVAGADQRAGFTSNAAKSVVVRWRI
jgi:hypothetical protein